MAQVERLPEGAPAGVQTAKWARRPQHTARERKGMKLVVPLAGRGSRYAGRGFELPKPLVRVSGRPMIEWAFRSLDAIPRTSTIFVALREHERYHVGQILGELGGPGSRTVLLDRVTEGQLCTVLAARELLSDDEDLLVASSDTIVSGDLATDISGRSSACRGLISVADLPGDHWSFARLDDGGRVAEVAEKRRISPHASTGLYYFSSGREFVDAADELIRRGLRSRGEFYVIPVYGIYIERGWWVGLSHARGVWDLGTPEGKDAFEIQSP
jgi:UDP-N-acetylglucosamine diphosphorylase / glucose-1-phosphate thymidylyltransferase / UDP-N-acetylgalactosamine diphosphorylase / glucosamine-1-phosphate N-acetyltransferase / galactosamine-1-phosphate N-acetyltransferase